jgi:hypothetical protein
VIVRKGNAAIPDARAQRAFLPRRDYPRVSWPGGKRFAFTIFDDPDSQTIAQSREMYALLSDLGFRTTVGVWPVDVPQARNSPGETCDNPEYRRWVQELQSDGFEPGLHCVAPGTATRPEILRGLDRFREYFGVDPVSMANHYNGDAMYWGPARLSGYRRLAYIIATRGTTRRRHFGEVEGHPSFWGDVCRQRVRYCRNFVYRDVNTLRACPWMPYHDLQRPYVRAWFASTEGANSRTFLANVTQARLEHLEEEGGACIVYAHFAHGFHDSGAIDGHFRRLMEWLSRRNGWFVPVGTLLGFLEQQHGERVITRRQRATLERRWLALKLRGGTS